MDKQNACLGWTWLALNTASAVGTVFVNKSVFTHGFRFPLALSLVHTLVSYAAIASWHRAGKAGEFKRPPAGPLINMALLHAGYMSLSTLSLALNTVSFYQVCKIASTPAVILLELVQFRKVPRASVIGAVLLVCAGVATATITDTVSINNVFGVFIGMASTLVTAQFGIQAGATQRATGLNSGQLLLCYTPYASLLLCVLVVVIEPNGLWPGQGALIGSDPANQLLAFRWTWQSLAVVLGSAFMGVAVMLTTFLAIAGTSTLTYSVVGHMKTLLVLAGACLFLQESMPWKRAAGIAAAFVGIALYTALVTVWKPTSNTEDVAAAAAGKYEKVPGYGVEGKELEVGAEVGRLHGQAAPEPGRVATGMEMRAMSKTVGRDKD